MNSKIIVVVILILIIITGILYFSSNNKSISSETKNMTDSFTSTNTDNMDESDSPEAMMTESKYAVYTPDLLENSSNKRRVLYFYANWCPTCRPVDAELKENPSKIPQDVIVIRVNYNDSETDQDEKQLAAKYGITYQHTFVEIDQTGKEILKWNGGDVQQLLNNLSK